MRPITRTAKSIAVVVVLLSIVAVVSAWRLGSNDPDRSVPTRSLPTIRGEERAVLTSAPKVPPPITRDYATLVIVDLETIEKPMRLADGVEYTFWTFGGTVPGNFIRVREGDLVELRLKNHAHSTVPHNIDLHAVTGPGGGAAATLVIPGGEAVLSFRALNPGLYVYHCAVSPVPMHIANGMYGLIFVQPKDGLPPVDREFYLMQSEFYTKPGTSIAGNVSKQLAFDMDKGIAEQPTYVVFNGSVGAIAGDNALKANVGESVRIFIGNAGPNLISSFHIIGEVFDNVYGEAGSMISQKNVQTTLVPAGGAAIVEFRAEMPGSLIVVDHSIFRAFSKGALGMINITGPDNPGIYKQIKGLGMSKQH